MFARSLLFVVWAIAAVDAEAARGNSGARPSAARGGGASKPKPRPKPSTPAAVPKKPVPKPQPSASPRPAPRPSTTPARTGTRPADARPSTAARPGARPGTTPPYRPGASGARPGYSPGTRTSGAPIASDVKNASLHAPGRVTRQEGFDPVVRPGLTHAPGSSGVRPGGPLVHSGDPRYSRPASHAVRPAPYAHDRPSTVVTYRAYYTGWYCHPWYRWQWGTSAVVWFGWGVYPWYDTWIPPYRVGWAWSPGYWAYGYWYPGYWNPIGPVPVGYVYVPGWWENEVYVEGYYRAEQRERWEWIDGFYLDDGTYVRGHWAPTDDPPDGYVWEAGFWDGDEYHDGFWRPEYRDGYTWVSSYYDGDGIYRSGYWMPTEDRPGYQWIPGWFDGNEWIAGYWVTDDEVEREDVEHWTPPEGVNDGWDAPTPRAAPDGQPPEARLIEERKERDGERPIAIPVIPPPEAESAAPKEPVPAAKEPVPAPKPAAPPKPK